MVGHKHVLLLPSNNLVPFILVVQGYKAGGEKFQATLASSLYP